MGRPGLSFDTLRSYSSGRSRDDRAKRPDIEVQEGMHIAVEAASQDAEKGPPTPSVLGARPGLACDTLRSFAYIDTGGAQVDAELPPVCSQLQAASSSALLSCSGTIKKFIVGHKFGFVIPDAGGNDVYVHIKDNPGLDGCQAGDAVRYDLIWDDR